MPDDVRVDSLDEHDMRELRRLKDWIYRTRTRARQDKERAERREAKETKAKGIEASTDKADQLQFRF